MSFFDWFSAFIAEEKHSENAASANLARLKHSSERASGVDRVVDRHLERIAQREQNLSEFTHAVSEGFSKKDKA